MISPAKQQTIVGGPRFYIRLSFVTVAVAMEDLLRTPLYHTLRTNQMGYIKIKAQLPGIYGNGVNQPRPRTRSVYCCINPTEATGF